MRIYRLVVCRCCMLYLLYTRTFTVQVMGDDDVDKEKKRSEKGEAIGGTGLWRTVNQKGAG